MSRSMHEDASTVDDGSIAPKQPNVGRGLSNEVRHHFPSAPAMMMESARRRVLVAALALAGAACHPPAGASQGPPSISPAPADSFRIRPGVALVANQQSADVSIIDLATGATTRVAVGTGPHEAAISPDGKWGVATVYGAQVPGNELAILDLAARTVTRTIDLGEYTRPHDVEFIPGAPSKVLVTSEATRKILRVDIGTGAIETTIATNANGSHMLGITGDAKRVFTANIGSGSVSELDLTGGAFVRQVAVAPVTEGIAVTPDGREVWVGSNQLGTVTVVDAASGTISATLPGFKVPYRLTVSPDGKLVIVCDPDANRIAIIDRATRTVVGEVAGLGSPRGVMVAADNRTALVTLGTENAVAIIDLVGRRVVRRIEVGQSPDGVAVRLAGVP
jgi:YVTN family beta-propeller protein